MIIFTHYLSPSLTHAHKHTHTHTHIGTNRAKRDADEMEALIGVRDSMAANLASNGGGGRKKGEAPHKKSKKQAEEDLKKARKVRSKGGMYLCMCVYVCVCMYTCRGEMAGLAVCVCV